MGDKAPKDKAKKQKTDAKKKSEKAAKPAPGAKK
jgi:hypothetical protein